MTKVKICGLFRDEDIEFVNICKPDYAGFVINYPKSHRSLDIERAKRLVQSLDGDIKSVAVVVNQTIDDVVLLARAFDIIQLHGSESNEYINLLKTHSKTQVFKAFKIRSATDLSVAQESSADVVLLDNGYGTGEQFDWSLIENFGRDFILAGGISSLNVLEAIKRFAPYAIDVSSSVESNKIKDFLKIKSLIEIVRKERL